jgi:cytochrome c oxidase subunit II
MGFILPRRHSRLARPAPCLVVSGCEGPLSTLAAGGDGAAQVAQLFWVMAAAAALVWLFVMAAAFYAARAAPGRVRSGRRLIVFGGVLLPLVLLTVLAWVGMRQTSALLAPAEGLTIHVTGERWWWRVRYEAPSGTVAVTANEVRLPQGERVAFELEATDVIHSFWIPSLGGKMDMIPGRTNRLALEASRPGRYLGACAEFCGLSHSMMDFEVVVMPSPEFEAWLTRQAGPAAAPHGPLAARGHELFLQNGCGACHNVAGTQAAGTVGPDLTHIGSRSRIAAGSLPADVASLASWIAHPQDVKPGALMPGYPMLSADELVAIGTYLMGLE